jgi:hypothetical protein
MELDGTMLDNGKCICAWCKKTKKAGGLAHPPPNVPNQRSQVICVDCLTAYTARQIGITTKDARDQRKGARGHCTLTMTFLCNATMTF